MGYDSQTQSQASSLTQSLIRGAGPRGRVAASVAADRGREQAERWKRRGPRTVSAVQRENGHQGALEVAIAAAICSLVIVASFFAFFFFKLEENHFTK